jgi:DNA-binding response OmpR family regulator
MTATHTIQAAQWNRTRHRQMSEVVVADDSGTILGLLVLALTREGFEPATAVDGATALEQIREHRPKLVILDAMMPNGDGYDVCRVLNEDPTIERPYVIMLSAAAQDFHRQRALDLGVDEFITKPFSTSELRKRVREILRP